jgi:hypothetical protein
MNRLYPFAQCIFCRIPDHGAEMHDPCVECHGTFELLNKDGICGSCRLDDTRLSLDTLIDANIYTIISGKVQRA